MLSFTYTGGFVLLAALLHAAWNAMLHGNRDRFLSITWIAIAIGLVSIVVVLNTPAPAPAAWPYIVASGLVHIFYNVSLVRSYRRNDLACAYPIARGGKCNRYILRKKCGEYCHYSPQNLARSVDRRGKPRLSFQRVPALLTSKS